jgi:Peptidase A4 family
MITSVLARRWLRISRGQPGEQQRRIRNGITRVGCAAAAAGIALTTAGTAAQAMAATQSLGPPSYDGVNNYDAGYTAHGRWFRFVSTTLTVAPPTVPDPLHSGNGGMGIMLNGRRGAASISVAPGGGTGSIWWAASYHNQLPFRLAPRIGDRLALTIFYDQHGHTYFTATDTTQGTTQTVRVTVGDVIYSQASLAASVDPAVTPPPATDTRLWQFTGTRLTTYTGVHGTMLGPWTTSEVIDTSTGTSSGRVAASPSGLSNNGQNFGVWLRALPLATTDGLAGYQASSGRGLRFVSTTLTVPAATQPASAADVAYIWLGQNGATPRAYATITVLPGGGTGSVSYATEYGPSTNAGTFAVSPKPGDRLAVSVYYDQQGHDYFTASDNTQAATQTVRVSADLAGTAYTTAVIGGEIRNNAVTPPSADTQLWDFSGSHVTTYSGDKGTILGPWATSEIVDTIDASASSAVVMSPSVLSNGGQNFGVWLRHQ